MIKRTKKIKRPLLVLDSADRLKTQWYLVGEDQVVFKKQTNGKDLLKSLDQFIGAYNLKLKDLFSFAVVTGPGSFSGLRSGIATFNALAWALNKPIYGLPAPLTDSAILKLQKKISTAKLTSFKKQVMPFYNQEPNTCPPLQSPIINKGDFINKL